MSKETIALASDHGGFTLKKILKEELEKAGYDPLDLGCHSLESVDYPDYAEAMAQCLAEGRVSRGVLICGSGIGISIAANRHRHVRAALVHDGLTARLSREHNNANVLVLGERTTGVDVARDCLHIFLNTDFEGGRHERRVAKMS
ncbi:ribose 5-phosphate isomerase B [Luteithermobacter gelatinilyticus]|uniref:ribose 5-phosphate isomerase B n=1 Tax=Luteithermobacter gelatinilyticus TaxID=2582913 RepID=UPI001107089B|nr:ribose 5-phosphate isomerase B [Luteithermobacter gelatinilyticus]|tara:strand:- start:437 stop:871 length:435 start_codon:yes stop_codon:yes gene_type:complete